jgi:hypothetical protein
MLRFGDVVAREGRLAGEAIEVSISLEVVPKGAEEMPVPASEEAGLA